MEVKEKREKKKEKGNHVNDRVNDSRNRTLSMAKVQKWGVSASLCTCSIALISCNRLQKI